MRHTGTWWIRVENWTMNLTLKGLVIDPGIWEATWRPRSVLASCDSRNLLNNDAVDSKCGQIIILGWHTTSRWVSESASILRPGNRAHGMAMPIAGWPAQAGDRLPESNIPTNWSWYELVGFHLKTRQSRWPNRYAPRAFEDRGSNFCPLMAHSIPNPVSPFDSILSRLNIGLSTRGELYTWRGILLIIRLWYRVNREASWTWYKRVGRSLFPYYGSPHVRSGAGFSIWAITHLK